MKRFTSKILICLVPVLLAALAVGVAYRQFQSGAGGFKLGVDLAGGTDLIYEIDIDKFPEGKLPDRYSPEDLAASLKRRIDPADLYNVTIRPVSNTRVEIILPTGGKHQAEAAEAQWNELLTKTAAQWPPKAYDVAVDRRVELIARINAQHPKVPTSDLEAFLKENYQPAANAGVAAREEAWKKLLAKVAEKYPPVGYEVGRGRLQVLVNAIRAQYPDVPTQDIAKFLDDNYRVSKDRRQVSSEEVQQIKELIAQVGSLEFRIIANSHDDKDAIEAAQKLFTDAQKDSKLKSQLDSQAIAGKPPLAPQPPAGEDGFPTQTNIGRYTYTWVELGPEERHSLGLNNAAANEANPNSMWKRAAEARDKGEATPILQQPAGYCLLYSRKVMSPRVADKDANKQFEYFVLTRDSEKGKEITGKYLVDAFQTQGQSFRLEVGFRFNDTGGRLFQELTTKNKPTDQSEGAFRRYLAVVLDGYVESAATIQTVIGSEGVIHGDFTKEKVDRLVRVFKAGQLPATLKPQPASENTIGPTLGEGTVIAGTWAVILAFVAILAFMLVYYRFAGLVACIALLANLLLTVAFMVLVNATFTLPGLAGLVLMLGMAVDANVLIYERLREERDRGASLALAIRNGYDRAFPTIIDTHLSSIFTAIVLYAVGNDQLKGFGISLTVGLIISLFTSLYMTRLMFDIWQHHGWLHKLSMFRLFSRPNIDFMAIRYYWFTATIILTVLGAAVFIYRLDRGGLNIDFMGGTAYGGRLKEMVTFQELQSLLSKSDLPDLSVDQLFVNSTNLGEGEVLSKGDRSSLFTVRTTEKDANKVQVSINKLLGDKLYKTDLHDYSIDSANQRATLTFTDSSGQHLASASRSQVGLLLAEEFNRQGMTSEAQQFILEGLGKEEDGRFQWMELTLVQPVERAKLDAVLKATQQRFAAQPLPERLENFDSQLAAETQKRALYAILASWAAILFYLWFRFGNWTFGLAAVLCLIHDLFFTLGIIAFCHYIHEYAPALASALLIQDFKIDLPAVAALLTLVGYSVNDTIVVFDRIREVRGKNPLLTPQMINDSVNQTLSRTLLTSFATWLVVIVLYIWGGDGVHLFAFVMVVGVIVGTYSSIYIASPLLLIFGEGAKPATLRERQPQAEGALT